MGGKATPAAEAPQSIVICSVVPFTCAYMHLLFLWVTPFSLEPSSGRKDSSQLYIRRGNFVKLFSSSTFFKSSKCLLITTGSQFLARLRSSLSSFLKVRNGWRLRKLDHQCSPGPTSLLNRSALPNFLARDHAYAITILLVNGNPLSATYIR